MYLFYWTIPTYRNHKYETKSQYKIRTNKWMRITSCTPVQTQNEILVLCADFDFAASNVKRQLHCEQEEGRRFSARQSRNFLRLKERIPNFPKSPSFESQSWRSPCPPKIRKKTRGTYAPRPSPKVVWRVGKVFLILYLYSENLAKFFKVSTLFRD